MPSSRRPWPGVPASLCWRLAAVLVLLAALAPPLPAAAVELEPIVVRSRLGEPFLAEIRLRDLPADSGAISARLPDPVVFARIGLPRPAGTVAQLRFDVRRDARGALLRVTSPQPVSEDFLTFLVQVDADGTSLVREFSVALTDGTPTVPAAISNDAAVAAAAAATVDAASANATAGATQQPVDPARVDPPADAAPASTAATEDAADATEDAPAAVAPPPIPVVASARRPPPAAEEAPAIAVVPRGSAPAPVRAAAPPPAPAIATSAARSPPAAAAPAALPAPAAGTIVVRSGDNLRGLARDAAPEGVALESMLVALMLENPHAIVGGDVNRLKLGAELRMPSSEALAALDPERARALVVLQDRAWRSGGDEASRQAVAEALAQLQADLAAQASPPARSQPAVAPAHMKIVPVAAADASDPASASQLPASPALQEELLAAREQEIEHLQRKVAELERNYEEQRQLLAMQNEVLAAAKSHLDPPDSGGLPGLLRSAWLWIVLAIGACLFAFFAWRRRFPPAEAAPKRRILPEPDPPARRAAGR